MTPSAWEAFKAETLSRVNGSWAAAACGLDPWKSNLKAYYQLTGELPLDRMAAPDVPADVLVATDGAATFD